MLDGQASDPVLVLWSVPQGAVLSEKFTGETPKLESFASPFSNLNIENDLPENIRSSPILFGDDCVLYRNIKSPMGCHILQDDLNSLAQRKTDWQMKIVIQ